MKVTIELSENEELDHLISLLKELNIKTINIQEKKYIPVISKGNKKIDPKGLFGIWKDNPRTLEEIRSNSWNRN